MGTLLWLGLVGVGSLAAAYVIDMVQTARPDLGERSGWAIVAIGALSAIFAPTWLALLGAGAAATAGLSVARERGLISGAPTPGSRGRRPRFFGAPSPSSPPAPPAEVPKPASFRLPGGVVLELPPPRFSS